MTSVCVQIKWIDQGPEHDELLVSISTDGRVTQWSIAKVGFIPSYRTATHFAKTHPPHKTVIDTAIVTLSMLMTT
jgi:hypothetical protein